MLFVLILLLMCAFIIAFVARGTWAFLLPISLLLLLIFWLFSLV